MSEVAAPSVALVFGGVFPPQADVVSLFVHLGCSKEVSSFEIKLHNWNGKYSLNGASPITVGMDGTIYLGRGVNCPALLTVRVEDVKYDSSPLESYVTVSGRCWGERLFRYTVSKSFAGWKGEAIVKYLMDYYAGLSHVRSSVELVQNTSTTYTNLEYSDSPAWDILKYVAETADNSGVIGYDFRIEPDGKFAFFPKLSKTNSTVITDNIDLASSYRTNITRIRNRIKIYGLADKSVPLNKVDWTRSLTPADGVWVGGAGVVSLDATAAPDGGACIKLTATSNYWGEVFFTLNSGKEVNANSYPLVDFQGKLQVDTYSGTGTLTLYDTLSRTAIKNITISADGLFHVTEVGDGAAYSNKWEDVQSGFDWSQIKMVGIRFYFPKVASGSFYIHSFYFGGCRYSSLKEDTISQAAFGTREYVETDEELWSDNECDLRAKSLLAYLKDPAEYLTVKSTLLDYGTSPILGGDKVPVSLPKEGLSNVVFRVESAEYRIPEDDPITLEITLELGKEAPQIADYIYGLRTFTVNVEKLARTKAGRSGAPVTSGGTGGNSYFTSNVEIDKTSPVLNLLISRTLKAAFGHDGSNAILASYAGDLVLYSITGKVLPSVIGGVTSPLDLGASSIKFSNAYFSGLIDIGWLNVAGFTVINAGRQLINTSVSALSIDRDGVTEDVAVAKVGGGTRFLRFQNSRYIGYVDS
jgi:hypothetical protein